MLPVLPALAPLLPAGGLAKGSVVAVDSAGALCLALIAGPSQAGMWCGIAGMPHLGIVAAAEAGAEPGRMMLVPDPGPQWPEVAATTLDACEVVLLRPPGRAPPQARRRLETAARRSGAALIAAGTWDGAPVRLHVTRQQWDGIGDGYGRLRARCAEVTAEGRAALARSRRAWLWLPGPDGKITAAARPADMADPPQWQASVNECHQRGLGRRSAPDRLRTTIVRVSSEPPASQSRLPQFVPLSTSDPRPETSPGSGAEPLRCGYAILTTMKP